MLKVCAQLLHGVVLQLDFPSRSIIECLVSALWFLSFLKVYLMFNGYMASTTLFTMLMLLTWFSGNINTYLWNRAEVFQAYTCITLFLLSLSLWFLNEVQIFSLKTEFTRFLLWQREKDEMVNKRSKPLALCTSNEGKISRLYALVY